MEQAQSAYAQWLAAGTWLSMVLLIAAFLAYVTGALPAHVPLDRLPELWGMPLERYLEAAHAPTGWGWIALAGHGDYFTYWGIVLLCSPLARALERWHAPYDARALREALAGVLNDLDVDDARAAYRAIAAAHPGGLGRSAEQDVAAPPSVGLLEAMALAADRDRVAAQYASGYQDLFVTGLASLQAHAGPDPRAGTAAVQALYLAFLGRFPDTHIVRKFGPGAAQAVTDEAAPCWPGPKGASRSATTLPSPPGTPASRPGA